MNKNTISIGCFGALRPLKNHLQQAIWAMMFADKIGKHLEFHINRSEFEKDESSPVLKNLHSLFSSTPHTLVEHPWVEHDEFLKLVKTMDLGLQMSFTETFNIVTADFVYCGVPIVVSDEIDWMNFLYKANPSNRYDVLFKMFIAYYGKKINLHNLNRRGLIKYNKRSINSWFDYIDK